MAAQLQQCKQIMKSHKCPSPIRTDQDLWKMLHTGILLDNIYYSLDNQARMCAKLYPKALTITWSSNPEYWKYAQEKIPDTHYTVGIAHLVNVGWLDVKGDFNTRKLSQGTEYEILFDIELTPRAQGWDRPVTFEYKSPTRSGRFQRNLSGMVGQGRRQISIGKFVNSSCVSSCIAPLSFHMFEHGEQWKNGLIMRGVIIRPV